MVCTAKLLQGNASFRPFTGIMDADLGRTHDLSIVCILAISRRCYNWQGASSLSLYRGSLLFIMTVIRGSILLMPYQSNDLVLLLRSISHTGFKVNLYKEGARSW